MFPKLYYVVVPKRNGNDTMQYTFFYRQPYWKFFARLDNPFDLVCQQLFYDKSRLVSNTFIVLSIVISSINSWKYYCCLLVINIFTKYRSIAVLWFSKLILPIKILKGWFYNINYLLSLFIIYHLIPYYGKYLQVFA